MTASSESNESETGSDTGFETGSDPPSVGNRDTPRTSPSPEVVKEDVPLTGQVLDLRHRNLESLVVRGAFSETLERLNVADCGLRKAPESIWDATSLVVFNVASNFLQEIPPEVSRLHRLRELHVDFNELHDLPGELSALGQLRVLSACGNRLTALPEALAHLTALESLRLSANDIAQLASPPVLQALQALRRLDLRSNGIQGVADFTALQNLQSLDVSWNRIEELRLPTTNRLRHLDCSRNCLHELNLPGARLETLCSSHNCLQNVDITLPCNVLSYIDLSTNQLVQVPPWVPQARSAQHLDLGHNCLTSVPASLFSPTLSQLDTVRLNHNSIASFPESITAQCHIRHLDLQHNCLTALPPNLLRHAYRLQWLNASYNELSSLARPDQASFPLRWLLLTRTGLTDEQVWPLVLSCPGLKVLQLAYNQLHTVPARISELENLRDLVLTGNALQRLPDSLASLPGLEALLLNCNRLDTLPNFEHNRSLKVLDVSCNLLSKVTLSSLVSPSLQQLDISCNQALFVDTQEFHVLCSRRNVSVVDTKFSGRLAPPFKSNGPGQSCLESPFWTTGFSESLKGPARLYINQCTQPSGHTEVLAAILESPQRQLLSTAKAAVAQLVRQERRSAESSAVFLQNIILSTYRALGSKACCHQLNILLCHLAPADVSADDTDGAAYLMTVAQCGGATCLLAHADKQTTILFEASGQSTRCVADDWDAAVQASFQTHASSSWPSTARGPPPCELPSPSIRHVTLRPDDRLVVLSTAALGDALAPEAALAEALDAPNPMAAAKRLNQAVASLVSDGGTCVIAIGLQQASAAVAAGGPGKSVHFRITTDIDDEQADEAEAYKAWEYMLAQNHKMLFNRELETLHRTLAKGKAARHATVPDGAGAAASGTARLGSKKKRYCYGQAGEPLPSSVA
ncbi:PH domain leucine-rich repeat-containing protein phosphatase 1-like [Dermacentor silvarum]|uniref:PH domain leucine-rich repeat-containing protein phosphatase 1-like n=1 Tax=Dermacentor silvarum TaxID=543639 RepID=UPI002101383F|nr:PH domain leucine-rich repeat-containing protein phosphatase 1-like [Dermacentor silvarum]